MPLFLFSVARNSLASRDRCATSYIETITTASALVESSSTVPGDQVVDPHDVIPEETPDEILLAHENSVCSLNL